jgi:hypothetical protein
VIRSKLYIIGNGKNTTQFRFKNNQLSQLFQFSNVIHYDCENVNVISFTQFPCKRESSSWVFTLVATLHSKLPKNYEVKKYFTVLMAARGKG